MAPPDPHDRSTAADTEATPDEPDADDATERPASSGEGPSREGDAEDPPLAELAAAATDRAFAKTIPEVAPRIPAAPKIPPPPAIGGRSRPRPELAFAFDLDGDDGPVSLSKLTAGPARPARAAATGADEDAPTLAREEAGAADALLAEARAEVAPGEPAAEAESSGRAGAPRLPPPGMLGKRSVPEFRDTRRPAKAPMGPGVVPPGGVMPPGAVEAHREPADTDVLIEVVAAELMEPDSDDALPLVAAQMAPSGEDAAVVMVGHGTSSDEGVAVQGSRLWMYGAAAVVLLLVSIWAAASGGDTPDGASEEADREPSRIAANAAQAQAEPTHAEPAHEASPPPPEPAADDDGGKDEAAATSDAAPLEAAADEEAASGDAGDPDAPPADMVIEPEPEPEPVPEADATPAAVSPKASSSGRRTSKRRKKGTAPRASKSEPAPAASSSATASTTSDDPKALLAQAKTALAAGNGSKAYSLAAKSKKLAYSSEAIEVMTVASCLKKDEGRAKALFKQIPLFQRANVKSRCKAAGVKVGI